MTNLSDAILARLLELHPKMIDLTLDRTWRLLEAVGNPQNDLAPVVHIAGTNGKGSTLAMIRAGLESDGHTVNAYTSPHLARFHERIRLSGALIDEVALTALLQECEAANCNNPITFFEITTVAALLAMARSSSDYTLLEVGLGGRLDATNVIEPKLTVITPVSLDHQQYLGEKIEEIAGEKAGIMKPAVPCVVGPQSDAALSVIEEKAEQIGSPLSVCNRHWQVREERGRIVFEDDSGLLDLPRPRLLGAHQIQNAGVALASLRLLGSGNPSKALTEADWPARMQRLKSGPLVDQLPTEVELWLDGGHNAAAGKALASLLREMQNTVPADLWLIVGMLDTKSAEDYLSPLVSLTTGVRTVTIPDTQASLSAVQLAERAASVGLRAKPAPNVLSALGDILQERHETATRVLICGSLYLAGDVLRENA